MIDCCILGASIFCYGSPWMSPHDLPINLQWDKCYSLFCNIFFFFKSLCELKSVIPLKVRALRMDHPVYFRLHTTFFCKRYRASMTQHRQQSTQVSAKGVDPVWRQGLLCYRRGLSHGSINSCLQGGKERSEWHSCICYSLAKNSPYANVSFKKKFFFGHATWPMGP